MNSSMPILRRNTHLEMIEYDFNAKDLDATREDGVGLEFDTLDLTHTTISNGKEVSNLAI